MKKSFIAFSTLFFILFTTGCSEHTPESEEIEIIDALNSNLKALQDEDLDLVKETMHPESPFYEATILYAEKIFERYDLKYELLKYNLDKINSGEAFVSFSQTTKKLNGPEFRDNKITGTHTFRKESGEWKIYSTKVEKIEYM